MRTTPHFNGAQLFIAQRHAPLKFFLIIIPAHEYFIGQSEELPVLSSPRFAVLATAHTCETHERINAHVRVKNSRMRVSVRISPRRAKFNVSLMSCLHSHFCFCCRAQRSCYPIAE